MGWETTPWGYAIAFGLVGMGAVIMLMGFMLIQLGWHLINS